MQQGIKKLQWCEYLKLVFLEILNPLLCRVFANQVTYTPQSSDLFTKSSDMLNKNTLGVKSARLIRSSPTYVPPKALISAEAKKSPIKDVSNYLNDTQ